MTRELFVLRFGLVSPELKVRAAKLVAEHTTRVAVVLPEELIWENAMLDPLSDAGIRTIVPRLRLIDGPEQSGPFEALHHKAPHTRSATAHTFMNFQARFGQRFELIPEVVLDPRGLSILFPTLISMIDNGAKHIQLDPTELTPGQHESAIRDAFAHLRMRGRTRSQIHFTRTRDDWRVWNARTDNLFSGPERLDLDVANTCTHNCMFCTFYSEDAMELNRNQNGGKLDPYRVKLLSARLDRERGLRFIEDLPETVRWLQFGGIGDPYTHPAIDEFISAARTRGFNCSVLSNFSYMDRPRIERLHELTRTNRSDEVHFVVNLSASDAKTYTRIRPNQTEDTFRKVLSSLQYARELARRDNRGIGITLLLVVNRFNYHNMVDFVRICREVEADAVWIKPLEIHSDIQRPQLPAPEEMPRYRELMKEALQLGTDFKMRFVNHQMMESLVKQGEG